MNVENWIKKYEGLELVLYKDTADKFTIGWGRNIQDNGINLHEAQLMFDNDYARVIKNLESFDWYLALPLHVQYALQNMCFNLGINRLLTFKKMKVALIEQDYTKAALEALDSKWAKQVGQRAKDIALMMREGYA